MNEFKKKLIAELAGLSDPNEIIESRQIIKTNDVVYDAITFRNSTSSVSKMIYIDHSYKEYKQGKSLRDIADEILTIENQSDINTEQQIMDKINGIYNMDAVRDNIVIRLLNLSWNMKYLEGKAHTSFLDLAIAFCIIEDFEDGYQSMLIPQEIVSRWNISNGDLLDLAKSNSERLCPVRIRSLESVLAGLVSCEPLSSDLPCENMLYVMTTEKNSYGASTILYQNTLKQFAADENVEQIVIIPSSTHEVLLYPCRNGYYQMTAEFNEMIKEVNRTTVDPTERLSDHPYLYDSKTDRISIL